MQSRFGGAACVRPRASLLLVLQACKVDLYSGLDERQANQMISELMKHGVNATRYAAKDASLTVRVDEDQFATAVEVLEALPAGGSICVPGGSVQRKRSGFHTHTGKGATRLCHESGAI